MSRHLPRFSPGLLLCLTLLGCNQAELMEKFASREDQAVARDYIEQLRHHQFDRIEAAMDPSLAGPGLPQTLERMAALFPAGEPTSATLVGARSSASSDSSTINLTYELGFSGKWVLTNVAVRKQRGNTTIVGFNVYPRTQSLAAANRFTLSGKSALQYAVLALTVLVPVFVLWTLVLCVRTPLRTRKWPWVLAILLGAGEFTVDWTTGQWGFSWLTVQLLGASATAPLYGSWTLGVSLPLGALVFLAMRDQLRASEAP